MPFLNVSISCKVTLVLFPYKIELISNRTYDRAHSTRTRTATSRQGSVH